MDFSKAEAGRSVSKQEFKMAEPKLHLGLLRLQNLLRLSGKSLIIIVAGVEGAGKGEVVDRLNRWFDTRLIQTHAYWEEDAEERERPRFWRFWRNLPAAGRSSVMFGSWYSKPIADFAFDSISETHFQYEMALIRELELQLALDGTIFVKLWFHLSKDKQQSRLREDQLNSAFTKRSPLLVQYARAYDGFKMASSAAIELTHTSASPWHIIEATDRRYRDLKAGEILGNRLSQHLAGKPGMEEHPRNQGISIGQPNNQQSGSPDTLKPDISDSIGPLTSDEYKSLLKNCQERLNALSWTMHNQRKDAVLVFEGWDAAGKGSAIRRITAAIDARLYRVIATSKPTDEEKAHHYLWRFWLNIPRAGYMTLYDRSWYGRVLAERVEELASEAEWQRAFHEINNLEEHLARHDTIIMKFWIDISKEEQLRRFEERLSNPRKQHKITDEDWRNREKWDDYAIAVKDMLDQTNTELAPWHLIAGNDKKSARIAILDTICRKMEAALG